MFPRHFPTTLLLLLTALAAPTQAQNPAEHEAEERLVIETDADLSLAGALEAALTRAPGAALVAAQAGLADRYRQRAGSWLAGAPSAQLRYLSDRWQTRQGLSEAEFGFELPLWRPGQRQALAGEAGASRALAGEAARLHRWQLAGLVRERYWELREASERLNLAQAELDSFRQLEAEVRARVAAGDAAPAEVLSAEGLRREREAAVHEAEVVLADRHYAWRVLTGLSALPAERVEPVTATPGDYLPLLAARAARDQAEAALAAGRREGAGAPRLLLGLRQDQQDGADTTDSLSAQLSLPFGGGSHRQARLAPLELEAARAADELRRQQQEAELAQHEAEHELHAREVALADSQGRYALASQELALARRAYALGESALVERLLSEVRAAEAGRVQQLSRLALARAIARYNQVHGVLP